MLVSLGIYKTVCEYMQPNAPEFQKVIDRIKALYALSKSTHSEHEAEAAMKAAQQIITKYKIDQELLEIKEKENYTEIIIYSGHKARIFWKEQVIQAVCHTNGCEILIYGANNPRLHGISYHAFGKSSNLEICKVLIELIINQIEYLAKEDKTIIGKGGKDSFKSGCAARIKERLKQSYDNEIQSYLNEPSTTDDKKNKLMRLNDLERSESKKFMEEKVDGISELPSKTKTVKPSAFQRGKEAGDKINLTPRKGLKD